MAAWLAIEMAELIERGLQSGVLETPRVFLLRNGDTCRAGVLGLALIARAGDLQTALDQWSPLRLEKAAEVLGISVAFARMLELNHRNGVPARVIARSLRAGTLGIKMNSDTTPALPLRAAAA